MSDNKHTPEDMVKLGFAIAQAYQVEASETLSEDDLANAKRHRMFAETILDLMKLRDELLAAIGTQAATDILAERQRQITAEGWTPEHDDQHEVGELATAAACYAGNAGGYVWQGGWPGEVWPWAREWWKPSTPRRDLVKSAAMILAEIERIDRAAIASAKGSALDQSADQAMTFFAAGSLGDPVESEGGEA